MRGQRKTSDYYLIGKIDVDFRLHPCCLSSQHEAKCLFLRQIENAGKGSRMARKCHRQENSSILFSSVSSSWGRAARAPRTRKSPGRSLFLSSFGIAEEQHSIRGDGEVDGDPSLGFDRFLTQIVRLEVPLLYRFLRGARQDRRTAQHVQILDQAVAADQRLQN